MYKELLFNPRYKFDLEGNFLFRGQLFKNDGLPIEIQDLSTGKLYRFDKGWLGLIAYHKVRLATELLSSIDFFKCDARHFRYKSGHLMAFRKPIILERDFRVVPGYTRYHVSKSGLVRSINTGTTVKIGVNSFGYPTVAVYDDDKQVYRNVGLHVLIARAWVSNPEPAIKLFVNHIDGVKSNLSTCNLEWVTGVENSVHATKIGLRKTALKCQVLDLEDGSVLEYLSIGEARRAIEVSARGSGPTYRRVNGVLLPAILKNRYVIKTDTDPEFYADLNEYKKLFSKHNRGPYYAKKLATGEVFEADSLIGLVNQIGVAINKIARAINSVAPMAIGGFVFKNSKEAAWPESYYLSEPLKRRSFFLEDLETGEEREFDSLNKLRLFIDADKITIERKLKAKKPYGKWFFTETTKSEKSYQTATSE